ncbi:MAG TPA: Gfo/Idh/MocA family oxidoreductase [Bryobacteraceae bacterium]|jgi:predicted dehydrogenase|nr:Gfo/Idh/MocA family oxidoreductase [Bryobacteraceae bacterium]
MTRVGVIGAGAFGKNHVRVVRESTQADLKFVVDADAERANEQAVDATALTDYRKLIGQVDAAIVAAPTTLHAEIGCALLEAGIDILIEKPIASTLEEATRLVETAGRCGRILQVGHLERFNPAVIALERAATLPLFFEIHRMSVFTLRSLDVDVVLDLMIHDLDIVLALARAPLKEIRAAGISVLSPKVDIANVRLEFEDGCIANLTASRVSTEKVRKLRLFQPRQYISLDYAKQSAAIFSVGGPEGIAFEQLPIEAAEPLKLQFDAFLDAVETRNPPKLDGATARKTLEIALAVLDKIREHTGVVEKTLASGWKP